MRAARLLADSLMPVLDLVFPPRCPACGAALGEQNGLCQACWSALVIPGNPGCSGCQMPLGDAAGDAGTRCAACLRDPPRHAGIAAATLYDTVSRQLVLKFKHGGRIALAPLLGRMIAARLGEPDPARIVVPVPLHRWRLWHRGYNQAALLGREIARLGHGALVVDALVRTRATPSLGGLGAAARAGALDGAIAVNPRHAAALAGREVILVDDVLTSGATARACVAVLRAAGAAQVRIACFARVPDAHAAGAAHRVPSETPEILADPGRHVTN